MDRIGLPLSGQSVTKKMRYDQSNASNTDGNPSKTTYSLATCLRKVQHLLRKPVKLEYDENAEAAQSNVKNVTTHSLESSVQKIKHLLPDSIEIKPVKKTQPTQQNEKCSVQQQKCQLKYDSTFLIEQSLQKVQHLLRAPVKTKCGDKSEEAEQIDDSDPTQSLMMLVDDCLLAIFDYLKPVDLINVAHTNVRLNKLVIWYVQKKSKVEFVPNGDWIERDRINVEVLQVFLGIFGGQIQSLTLNRKSFDNTFNDFKSVDQILCFIQKYCHLQELELIGFGMCGLMQSFFNQLKSLTLDDCSVTRDWTKMKQLTTLKLNKVIFRRYPFYPVDRDEYYAPRRPVPIPFDCFGALKKVELTDVNIDNPNVVKLINTNRQLKSLSIVKCKEVSPYVCEHVGQLKQHLEEFVFKRKTTSSNNIFLPLNSLKKLKVLKLTHPNIGTLQRLFDRFVENRIALEHLELGLTLMDSSVAERIAKIQSIKILKFNEMVGLHETHVTSIVSQLKLLEELHVKTIAIITPNGINDIVCAANRLTCLKLDAPQFVLDVDTYQTVLITVQGRETESKLKLTIYGNGKQLAVPSDILNGPNEKWLTVDELNWDEHQLFEDLTPKIGPPPPPRYNYSDSEDSDDYY